MSNKGSVINACVRANSDHIRLGHHWITPIGIQTDILTDLTTEKAIIPNKVLAPANELKDPCVFPFSAPYLLRREDVTVGGSERGYKPVKSDAIAIVDNRRRYPMNSPPASFDLSESIS